MPRFALKQRLVVVGPLVLLLLLTGFLPPAHRALAAGTVTIDPLSGLPGATVHATGNGWVSGDHIEVRWETQDLLVQTIINNSGGFDFYFTVPFDATSGSRTIYFNDVTNGSSLTQSFIVEPPDSVWLGNSQGGDLVWMVIKGSYITTIQFKATDGSVKTCFNVLITNYQFSCTTNGGSTTIEGHYASLNQVIGTYTNYGQQVQWTAMIFSQSVSSIRGQITDSANAPMAGVTVSAAGPTAITTTTDIQGNYVLDGLADGNYTITPSKSGYTFNPSSSSTTVPPDATGKNFIGTAPVQPTVDLSIDSVSPVQAVEGTDLVINKSTAVKVVLSNNSGQVANNVNVILYNHTHGVSLNSFYVNGAGNWDSNFILQNPSTTLNLPATTKQTVYFFGEGLTPLAVGSYSLEACVQYSNDSDPSNNCKIPTPDPVVRDRKWGNNYPSTLELLYMPVDIPNNDMKAYKDFAANLTSFVAKTYPIAESDISRKTSTTTFHLPLSCNGVFWPGRDLGCVIGQIETAGKLADPNVDRVIGIYPDINWIFLQFPFYHGNVVDVTQGFYWPNTDTSMLQLNITPSAGAHELGHSFGIKCEEYSTNCFNDPNWEPIAPGNKLTNGSTVKGGIDVSKRQVMNDGDVRQGIEHRVYNFMGSGAYNPPNPDRWVSKATYQYLLDSVPSSSMNTYVQTQNGATQGVLLVSGMVSSDGHIQPSSWYHLSDGESDILEPGDYLLQIQDANGNTLSTQSFNIQLHVPELEIDLTQAPFVFKIPYPNGAKTVLIYHGNQLLVNRQISTHAPIVSITSPQANDSFSDIIHLRWRATDLDGDTMSYAVMLSDDNGVTWNPLAIDLSDPVYDLQISGLQGGIHYRIKVVASDGVNTGENVSGSFTVRHMAYMPITVK